MFDEISGIPAHPLLVHGAVIFIPLQVLAGIAYAVLPFTRKHVWWATLALAVVGPAAAFFAKESGEALEARLVRGGMTDLTAVREHADFAGLTLWFSLALGVLMIAMVALARRTAPPTVTGTDAAPAAGGKVISLVLAVAIVGVGAATGYYVFKTGDTGAKMVWSGL
ncbi:DUF2231 domain-containing protein [Luedemannella helvata]|uniref:DUF2231 domain-containing protein n=1 Tax=Luedemannella helvata TaxID=349315 RepID=A0ABN2L3P7_9ACTN